MCGIFGCSIKPNANKQSALAKFKILGIYNMTRGRDASGVYINGAIKKTVRDFDDYIEDNLLTDQLVNTVVMGHNRQGSTGYSKTVNQAHPHMINDGLVITHNGTIEDTEDLCKKYNLDKKDYDVDTKILGTLLYTEGPAILNEYKGMAALAYVYVDEPETLYLYRGESKRYKAGQPIEERPLFFMETEEGIFYSSIEDSLKAIREKEDEKPEVLVGNYVFPIKNGEFDFDNAVEVTRGDSNVTVYTAPVHVPAVTNRSNYNRSGQNYNAHHEVLNSHIGRISDFRLVYKESIPKRVFDSKKDGFKIYKDEFVYAHQGRYWKAPRTLVEGPIYLKRGGLICSDSKDKAAELCYFHHGVMLKGREAYKAIMDLKAKIGESNWVLDPKKFNFAMEISKYSLYPVTSLIIEYNNNLSDWFKCAWYFNKDADTTKVFTPRYSGRSYNIKKGVLTDVQSSHKEKCLYAYVKDADDQIKELHSNTETPGGSLAPEAIFPQGTIISEREKETRFLWFFEKTYPNLSEFLMAWGTEEFDAFHRYAAFAWERDLGIVPLKEELKKYTQEMIDKSIKQSISIADLIEEKHVKGDADLLLEYYNDVLDAKNELTLVKEESRLDKIGFQLGFQNMFKSLEKIVEDADVIEEKENQDADVTDIIETSLIQLNDLQLSFFSLCPYEDSELAQSVGEILIGAVNTTLSNLKEPLEKANKKDLLKKLNKIIETKTAINGIL